MKKIRLGFAMCGSFCTISKCLEQMKNLVNLNYDIVPIVSYNLYNTDTRFGKCKDIIKNIEEICSKKVISTIEKAEPIGPKNMTDIMLVAPCTGNTLSKLDKAITDTPVTMAIKSHLRGQKPVLIALATNDALGASAKNLGSMLNTKNFFFVPLKQDDVDKKPNSLVADFELIPQALEKASLYKQIEPLFV